MLLMVLALGFLGGTVSECYAANTSDSAEFLSIQGKAQARTGPTAVWQDAVKGATLGVGAEILTGSASSCEIRMSTNREGAVKLGADSHAVLTALNPILIDLSSGKIFSLVKNLKKGSSFEVRTPTAVATVRGTGWEQTAHAVYVFNGTVHVIGKNGQEVDVPEGFGVTVGDDGSLGELFQLSDEMRSEWHGFNNGLAESTLFVGGASDENNTDSAEDLMNSKEDSQQQSKEDDVTKLKGEPATSDGGGTYSTSTK